MDANGDGELSLQELLRGAEQAALQLIRFQVKGLEGLLNGS